LDLGDSDLGWRVGPIAFLGTSRDAALLCARSEDDLARIIRVDAAGEAMSILEGAGPEIRDAPEILSLTRDASRPRVWGAATAAGASRAGPGVGAAGPASTIEACRAGSSGLGENARTIRSRRAVSSNRRVRSARRASRSRPARCAATCDTRCRSDRR